MFPTIPREVCATARRFLYWISSSKRRGRRGDMVTVNMSKKLDTTVGFNYSDGDASVIKFQEIEDICTFELENNYVIFGGKCLEMVKGVGAGSPLAMINAQCYTLYCHYCWLMSIYDTTWVDKTASLVLDLSAGSIVVPDWVMYVDDARGWCAYTTPESKASVMSTLCSYHQNCFHTDTALEEEPVTTEGFQWLQGVFSFRNRSVECVYQTKNWKSWCDKGEPAFKSTQDYFSYSRSLRKRKFSVLVGKFCEIERFSFPASNIIRGVQRCLPDMKLAAIPKSVVNAALHRMVMKSVHSTQWCLVQGMVDMTY